jgi:hypothetical protein
VYTLHWLTIEARDLINMPISGYYKLSSNYHQWDVYIRHSSYICLAFELILKHGDGSLYIHNIIDSVLMYELLMHDIIVDSVLMYKLSALCTDS